MDGKVLSLLRPELNKLQAYAVQDATGLVKLDAMENPFAWPANMRKKWLEHISHAQINRYPEPNPEKLKQKLKHQFGPHDDSGLLLGNGSDELIQLLVLAIAKPAACILTVSPSFSMYQMIAEMIGVSCHVVPLDENYELDLEAMLEAIEKYNPALVFLAYPNNPTGNLWSRNDIQAILDKSQGIVVIDEAYGPFAGDSFTNDLVKNHNMVLLRTASKLGLAAIRFGWLAGNAELIAELNKIRLPYNINLLTQLTMEFALDHYELFAEQAETIRFLRGSLFGQLSAIIGVTPYRSEANFILIKMLEQDASDVFNRLLEQKVLIKNVSKQAGLAQCLRVTVGSKEENKIFCDALINALSQ
ncbi:MAG: histidinol-phosphate transaminase [Gammaproteobacteria bacterium]|nr:histidinol-phosphate transaminase [Gammaproteobacteria bacterium]